MAKYNFIDMRKNEFIDSFTTDPQHWKSEKQQLLEKASELSNTRMLSIERLYPRPVPEEGTEQQG